MHFFALDHIKKLALEVNETTFNCGFGLFKSLFLFHFQWFSHNFTVLVPDFYRSHPPADAQEARHKFNKFDWTGGMADIQASIDYLRSKGAKKVGITGFCMGGALTLASAELCTGLDAAAVFYGIASNQLVNQSKVILFYLEKTKIIKNGFSSFC